MKLIIAILSAVLLVGGCCSNNHCNLATCPTHPPVDEPIDGTKKYPAQAAGPGLFVVTLPHGTDATRITRIEVWVNTDGMEAHRVNNQVTYDEVHLVTDGPTHTLIAKGEIYRSMLNGPGPDEDVVTTGSAVGSGDVFDLSSGGQGFDALVSPVSRGTLWVRLKPNQPKPRPPHVLSASVKLSLKP